MVDLYLVVLKLVGDQVAVLNVSYGVGTKERRSYSTTFLFRLLLLFRRGSRCDNSIYTSMDVHDLN